MEDLLITGANKTPEVKFETSSGNLSIKGRSIPENTSAFYQPIMEWLDVYSDSAKNSTSLTIELEYFNTSSSKCLLDIFRKLELMHENKKTEVLINWRYAEDDEDIMEAGEDYQSLVNLKFELEEF